MFALLAAISGPTFAGAQIYQFDKVPFPDPRSLHTMYVFYVYSHQEAPEKNAGHPFVKFHSLKATAKPGVTVSGPESAVQVSILPYADFWALIDPNRFCATELDVQAGRASHVNALYLQKPSDKDQMSIFSDSVRFDDGGKDNQTPVRFTGVYILVYSNCGDFVDATVSGSIIVKNAYGFLPGNEYHKLPFYGWLSLVYVTMALVWMGLSLKWWRQLFHIQYCIALVILLGLLEAFLFWIYYNDWNVSGSRSSFLFVIALFASVIKTIFSYMLVLVAALGWGVTRPYLDQRTILKLQAVAALYIIIDFIRETVLSFRHSHSLSLMFVLLCLLPVALLNGGIFYWIFMALSNLTETLRERRQQEKLALFERLGKILVGALGLASITLLFQILDLSRSVNIRWHYQWLFSDGVSHLLYCLVLASMMFLWAPNMNSQRYVYSQQVDGDDKDEEKPATNVWAEDDREDDDGDDSFWATTHGQGTAVKPALRAEKIGVSAD